MSKEHRLAVGKNAMKRVYKLFEIHLYSTYACILGELFSRGVAGEKLIHRIKHTSDPDQAFHMLLDHLCEQDSENLQVLVEVLYDSGSEECLPGHSLLADKLKYHMDVVEKDAEVTAQTSHLARSQSLSSSANNEPSHSFTLSTSSKAEFKPTGLPSSSPAKLQSHTVREYPELVSSLLYFFDDKLENDEDVKPACSDSMMLPHNKCAYPYHGMPLITFAGPLKGRTHEDLVILLCRLSGTDATKSNLAYQLIRGKKQLPIDLQIINVLGAVYATSDNSCLFQEALQWTQQPDCLNPVYLQCRLNYLLSICTLNSDRELSEQYLKQAQELSAMCEPDFITALLVMQEARTIFLRAEEQCVHLDEQTLMQIMSFSNRACAISHAIPAWMQPFAMVLTLLKMQLDARIAFLLFKLGNCVGAIAAVSPLSHLAQELEDAAVLHQLIPRQQATHHYVKAVISFINRDSETAMTNATRAHSLYLKVNSVGPSERVMELINNFR